MNTNLKGPILIVEDDLEIRDSLKEILTDEGFNVCSVGNGKEALGYLQNGVNVRPSLILLDIMMPVMDGYQFREEQLKNPSLSLIPTVLLSAGGHLSQKAARVHVAEFLKKPIDLDCLFGLVEKYCRS